MAESTMAEPTLRVLPDADSAVKAAAAALVDGIEGALAARGRCVLALSGGTSAPQLCRALATHSLDWDRVNMVQVDERLVPLSHPDRSLGQFQRFLPPLQIHPMPVEDPDPDAAARAYTALLEELTGTPAVLDVVHLGLGADGHTGSLVPGEAILQVLDRDVALTDIYKGHRRMTLTFPLLNRAREIVWLATGMEKRAAIRRFYEEDPTLPASCVSAENMYLFTDQAGI